jgi:hypothetical protein
MNDLLEQWDRGANLTIMHPLSQNRALYFMRIV